MNRPDEPGFEEALTLVSLPSETEGGDPLALFESESESDAQEPDAEVRTSVPPSVPSFAVPLPAPTRTRPPLALDHLLRRLGHVQWAEAVAIVEGLCGVLLDRETLRVPEMSRVAITAEGTVIVGTAASKDAVGPLLARMIHTLAATGSIPAPLRLFITKWTSASEHHSIAEFAKDLAYFARPEGQTLIRGVYERAMSTAPIQPKPLPTPSRELTLQVPRRKPQTQSKGPSSRVLYGTAVAVVVLGVVATALLAWRGAPPPVRPPASESPSLDISGVTRETARAPVAAAPPRGGASTTASAISSVSRRSVVRAPQAAATGSSSGGRITVTPRASIPVSSAVRASLSSPGAAPSRIVPSSPETGDPASRAVRLSPSRAPRRDGILGPPVYSRADADVIPPAFLYPQLPGQILGGLRPDMNTLELIVSETGVVERVKLLSTPKRMADMMLLSGAKNWEFEPATKDGQSVRYRLELSWAATP